jgi:glycosyltransferase involved in cell wall biosynthesis
MAFFSVIIPTYNRSALLREALDSVFAQTFTDYEAIVVDDGSTDDTHEVIAGYGDRVRFYRQENRGPGEARNLGIQNATGKYVAFLDSDDVWFPWTLATYYEIIQKCRRPGFVAGKWLKFGQSDKLKVAQKTDLQHNSYSDYYAAWQGHIDIAGCGVVVRTTAIASTAGFLKGMVNAEDSDMWMKLGTVSGFVQLNSPVVFGYRETSTSVSKTGTKSFVGIRQMVLSEKSGAYPGGINRRRERWQILTRHVRPASLGCLNNGDPKGAWWLYWNSGRWHLATYRFRYLIAFPLLLMWKILHSSAHKRSMF